MLLDTDCADDAADDHADADGDDADADALSNAPCCLLLFPN